MCDIEYDISMRYSVADARHWTAGKNQPRPLIRLYLPKITYSVNKRIEKNPEYLKKYGLKENTFFWNFYADLVYMTLLERVCLGVRLNNKERVDRGLKKIRIQGRCKKYKGYNCKMSYVTGKITGWI